MAAKRRPNRREPHRTSTRPPARPVMRRPSAGPEELPQFELLTGLDEALRDPHPLALLTVASTLMAALDPRNTHPLERGRGPETPPFSEIVEAFMDAGFRQTDALLKVLAELARDDLLHERIRRLVAERRHPIPTWLLRLDQVTPYRAVTMTHVLADGDNVVVGVRLPGNRECSILVYIDHNLGTLVKDAFVLDRPLAEVIVAWSEADSSADTEIGDIPLADARARITPAIDVGAITFPPFESDTWPACRPLVEWIVSMMPEGGVGYEQRPEWSEKQLAGLADDFFASASGRALDDDDHRSLLESILWYGTDYGPGDPLRWSPVAVEILLDDWIPRKLVAPAEYLGKVPELLRAFVRYCHAERRIPRELTEQTIAAVDGLEPEYQEAIRTPRHQGPMALLERMGVLDPRERGRNDGEADWHDGWGDGSGLEEYMLDVLAREVGGLDALDRLAITPLPDEAFEWDGIPEDVHARVAEVLELVDGCCDALFDAEFRTAARRFLARVAVADPGIFRRRGLAGTAASAVCWVIGKANDSFDFYNGPGVQVKELMAHFGLTGSSSQRADVMLRALGIDWRYGHASLGDPGLLLSAKRADIVALRDQFSDQQSD
ncbi:MAG: DUF6398 domain-containing protein [Lacisediminihabitans sp.]